jgi:hypothetical protein
LDLMMLQQVRLGCQRFCFSAAPAALLLLAVGCARPTSGPAPVAAAAAPAPASAKPSAPAAAVGKEEAGTIKKVGEFGFGIVPDRDPGTRYAPDNLPADLKVDGTRVLFSGKETPPPEGVRLWGTPFHVTAIRRAP